AEVVQRRLDVEQVVLRAGGGAVLTVVVGRTGLHRLRGSDGAGLRLGVVSLVLLVQERRNSDRGKDADDQDDDQELDQGETLLCLGALAELPQHSRASSFGGEFNRADWPET